MKKILAKKNSHLERNQLKLASFIHFEIGKLKAESEEMKRRMTQSQEIKAFSVPCELVQTTEPS